MCNRYIWISIFQKKTLEVAKTFEPERAPKRPSIFPSPSGFSLLLFLLPPSPLPAMPNSSRWAGLLASVLLTWASLCGAIDLYLVKDFSGNLTDSMTWSYTGPDGPAKDGLWANATAGSDPITLNILTSCSWSATTTLAVPANTAVAGLVVSNSRGLQPCPSGGNERFAIHLFAGATLTVTGGSQSMLQDVVITGGMPSRLIYLARASAVVPSHRIREVCPLRISVFCCLLVSPPPRLSLLRPSVRCDVHLFVVSKLTCYCVCLAR